MSDEATTKPTLETLSNRLEELASEMRAGFAAVNHMLEQMDMRLDGIESLAHQSRSEVLSLRKEFKAFRSQFKAPA